MHLSVPNFALCVLSLHALISYSMPAELDSEYSASFARDIASVGRTELLNLILARSMQEAPPKAFELEPRASADGAAESCPKCTKKKCADPKQYREQINCQCIGCPADATPKADMTSCDCPQGQQMSKDGKSCSRVCPQEQKPSPDGKSCIRDCPPGQRASSDGKSCLEDCGVGKKQSTDGKSCIPDCKNGQVPNAAGTACEEDKKKKMKEEKFKDTQSRELGKWKDQRKTRMGKCLTIVPLMMRVGGAAGLPKDNPFEWCSNWFDEEYVNDDQMMTYWPSTLTDVDWSINMDDQGDTGFLHLWTDKINQEAATDAVCHCGICTRDNGEALELQKRCPPRTRDIAIRNADLITRQSTLPIIGSIIEVVLSFLSRFMTVAARVAAGASRLVQLINKGEKFLKIARKGEKVLSKGADDMKNAADKISKNNKLWQNCLRGKGPNG